MNKKITSSALAALMIAGSTSFTALAAMSNGTVVIGNKAFDLAYANDPVNAEEITNAIVAGGAVYVKDFEGNWIDNTSGLTVNASVIPAVVYKDAAGEINYDAADKDEVGGALEIKSVSAATNTNTFAVTLSEEVEAQELTGKKLTLTPVTGTVVEATFKSVSGKIATFEFAVASAQTEYVVSSEDFVIAEGMKVAYDKTAPTLKVADSKFSDYKTMTIALSEKVTGTPVVKVNGVVEKAENVTLAANGMSITVARSSEFAVGTFSVVVNGLKDIATNSMIPDSMISIVKDASYPIEFTNITSAITNLSKDVYLTAVDQYEKAYSIAIDSSYKLTVTVNGMPLSASEATLTTKDNMAKVTIVKTLVEKDAVVIKVDKFDKDATSTTAKLLSTLESSYIVGKDAAAIATSILGVTASADTVLAGDAAVTLTADARDQFNNPADLTVNKLRWVIVEGGNLLDTTGDLNSNTLTADKTGNKATFKAVKPGRITINVYNMYNGAKSTYTVEVGAAKLSGVTLTSENPVTLFNNETIKYNKIAQNDGSILTADMIKFNVVAKTTGTTTSDIVVTAALRGGTGVDKNDIVISAKTTKIGTYEVTPYVGTSFDAEGTIKAAKFDVVTTLNPTATKIDAIALPMLKVNTKQKVNLVVRNTHNEVIDVTDNNVVTSVYKAGTNSNDVVVEELNKDGVAIEALTVDKVVKSLRFNATAAGNYTVRVSISGTIATYDISVASEVTSLQSIELGNNIIDNSIIANATDAVYRVLSVKDNKGDEITPDTSLWNISTKNGSSIDVDGFASLVYYKHDAKGVIVDATQTDAEGIAVKFAPNAASVKDYTVDTMLSIVVGNKDLTATDVIKDTLNVTVKAKSTVKAITIADTNITVIPGASVKKEIVVLDQYGKAIIDPLAVTATAADDTKVTAAVSYDSTAKKMYIVYTGVKTGTDTIVVKSAADATVKTNVNVTIGDNTNISSIAFDAYNYKVYNSTTDANDQTVTLTYKVNGGALDLPADQITVIGNSNVDVIKEGSTIKVTAKAGINTAATGIGDKDGVVTISVLTANGKTSSIDLTFSDDEAIVNKASVVIKEGVDENKDAAGTQLIIGKDKDGNVVSETTGQIILVGKDQYGIEKEVQANTTWASANNAIATVDASGLVTKVATGKTTVTGFYNGNLYTVEVEVLAAN